jgi:hypothetical protein
VYVDGTQVGSSLVRQYGSPGVLADASFSVGAIRGGASGQRFVGEVARLRFDDAPLTGSDITTLHSTYLGAVGIPEPSSFLLMGFGALSLFAMRRRSQCAENK